MALSLGIGIAVIARVRVGCGMPLVVAAMSVMGGCSGDPFALMPALDDAGESGPPVIVPDPPDAMGIADAPHEVAPTTVCGHPRVGDAPTYDREICVPTTTFPMGNNGQNLGAAFADHTPVHQVTLSAHFLDAYEITVGRYRQCVERGTCTLPQGQTGSTCSYTATAGSSESLPVNCVTWEQARVFCKWDGRRLPTEAEWELAARGTDDRSYPWGMEVSCDRAVLARYAGGPCPASGGPLTVGSMASGASPQGVFDLAGNAAEWVADWAGSYPAALQTDPVGPPGGAVKILRGGSWDNGWTAGLGYARTSMDPTAKGSWGFRCARAAEP